MSDRELGERSLLRVVAATPAPSVGPPAAFPPSPPGRGTAGHCIASRDDVHDLLVESVSLVRIAWRASYRRALLTNGSRSSAVSAVKVTALSFQITWMARSDHLRGSTSPRRLDATRGKTMHRLAFQSGRASATGSGVSVFPREVVRRPPPTSRRPPSRRVVPPPGRPSGGTPFESPLPSVWRCSNGTSSAPTTPPQPCWSRSAARDAPRTPSEDRGRRPNF